MPKRKRNAGTQNEKLDGGNGKKDQRKKAQKEDAPKGEVWSKSKKKRMRKRRAQGNSQENNKKRPEGQRKKSRVNSNGGNDEESPSGGKSTLQQAFMARLSGARFRELNEELYTTTSKAAFDKFSSNPALYTQYHNGFRNQVENWPTNPVDVIVGGIVSRHKNKESTCVVADFGCGDAALAKKLLEVRHNGECPFRVHSFDLVASCPLVTACDMANVPLKKKSVNVAVFCLSLMGTNLADFIREAYRVLKPQGVLSIAEVRSRFESSGSSKDELQDFIQVLHNLGFDCSRKDRSNKMFVLLELIKTNRKPDEKLQFTAKPCIYKRR